MVGLSAALPSPCPGRRLLPSTSLWDRGCVFWGHQCPTPGASASLSDQLCVVARGTKTILQLRATWETVHCSLTRTCEVTPRGRSHAGSPVTAPISLARHLPRSAPSSQDLRGEVEALHWELWPKSARSHTKASVRKSMGLVAPGGEVGPECHLAGPPPKSAAGTRRPLVPPAPAGRAPSCCEQCAYVSGVSSAPPQPAELDRRTRPGGGSIVSWVVPDYLAFSRSVSRT